MQEKEKAVSCRGPLNMPMTNMNKSSTNCMVLVNQHISLFSNWKHQRNAGFQRGAPHALCFKRQTKTHTDVMDEREPRQTNLQVASKAEIYSTQDIRSASTIPQVTVELPSVPHNGLSRDVIAFCCCSFYLVWPRIHES